MPLHPMVAHAFREHSRYGMTADVWESLIPFIEAHQPICFSKNPSARLVAHYLWKLIALRIEDESIVLAYANLKMYLTVSLLMIGVLGGPLCPCTLCSWVDLSRHPLVFQGSE